VLADADASEGLIQADLDLDQLAKYRTGLPFLKDMRATD
jgi:predicted amidohydrolase